MKNNLLSITVIGLVCGLALGSCAINRTIKNKALDTSIVPVDFDPNKHVILVVKMPRDRKGKINRQMNDLLTKYYPGKYEIVESNDLALTNSKYADTSVYKYAVLNTLTGVTHTTNTTTNYGSGNSHTLSPSATTTYIAYRFLDRSSNTAYGTSYPSAWLKTSVQAFANTVKKAKSIQ